MKTWKRQSNRFRAVISSYINRNIIKIEYDGGLFYWGLNCISIVSNLLLKKYETLCVRYLIVCTDRKELF